MSRSVQQIFVRSSSSDDIKSLLQEYVETFGNQFVQCSTVRLAGVAEVLNGLIRTKREFRLFTDSEWTVIWEIVHHAEFADPAVARFLSERMGVDSIWIKLDSDYNIWACQEFRRGEVISEVYLPESYFKGESESEERFDYGLSDEFAEAFNASRSLPLFLATMPAIERMPKISRRIERLVCRLPGDTSTRK